jgi:hypothetical protein
MYVRANGAGSAVDGMPHPATVEASGSRFTGPEDGTAFERGMSDVRHEGEAEEGLE